MADTLKIVSQEPITKSAPLSIISQVPVGQSVNLDAQGFQPMHMTSPTGEDVMVPHDQVGSKLQQGFNIGLPSQQSKLGEQVIPSASSDTSAGFHATAPASSFALGLASGAGLPESTSPVTDLLKGVTGYEAHKRMLSKAAIDLAKGKYVKGGLELGASVTPGLPQAAEMVAPSVEQGKQAFEDFRQVISRPDKKETWAAAINKAAPGKNPAQFTAEDWQKTIQIFNQDAKTQFHPSAILGGLIHTGGMIPVVGPAAVGAGEEIGRGIENRNIDQMLHGAGAGIGTIGALALGTRGGQKLAEGAVSKTVRPVLKAVKETPTVIREAPATAASKLLGGGSEAMAKAPIKQATAAGTATNAAVDEYAASKGINLLPGQATGSRGLKGIQAVGERAVVAPGKLPDVLEGQKAAFGNLVDDFKTRVSIPQSAELDAYIQDFKDTHGYSPSGKQIRSYLSDIGEQTPEFSDTESIGQNIKSQAQAKLDELKTAAQRDYQGFQETAGDIPVDLSEVKTKAADALKNQAEALKNVPARYSAPIRNVLTKLANLEPGGAVDPQVLKDYENAVVSYGLGPEQQASLRAEMGIPEGAADGFKMSTAQQLRSAYLDISRDYSGNIPKSVQRYAAQAVRDIDAAMAKAADSVGATDQWRQANAKWKELQKVYNDPASPIYRILQEPSNVKVPGKILGKGTYGGDPAAVRTLKNQGIDLAPLKQEVVQQIAAKNFSLTNGGRGLGGFSMQFLGELFNPAELDELTKMGRVSRAINFELNPSGTSNAMEGSHQIRSLLRHAGPLALGGGAGFALGGPAGALVGALLAGGGEAMAPSLASRLTTSEMLARAARGAEPPFSRMLGGKPPLLPPSSSGGKVSIPKDLSNPAVRNAFLKKATDDQLREAFKPGGPLSVSGSTNLEDLFRQASEAVDRNRTAAQQAPTIQPNASGESAASLEAINRAASEKAQGLKRIRIDTRSGKEIPLIGADAVDAKAGPYDRIVLRGPNGDVTLDEGTKARPMPIRKLFRGGAS